MSVAGRLGFPEAFQTALLVLTLLLALAPHLSGLAVAGVQVPRLDPRRRRMLKVVGPAAFLLVILLVIPVRALAPRDALQLIAVDATPNGQIDVAIANTGDAAALLTSIELTVMSTRAAHVRPVLATTATYRVPLGDLEPGRSRRVIIRHLLEPNTTERIVIAPETSRPMRVRVSIGASGGVVFTRDVELW